MADIKTFENRWVVIFATQHIVKKSTFRAKSYPTYSDAIDAARKAENRIMVSASVIDTNRKVITKDWIVLDK